MVEDQFLIASDIIAAFEEGGFGVAGPVSTLEGAMALLDEGHDLAGAVVDLRLQGDLAYPLVDKLLERRIPTVLSTGYDWSAIPERYGSLPRFEKPVDPFALVEVFREGNS
ncbi:response regulator [Acetobacteraceae bacterium H6797]|nr:response regulator [Acetobacteraceae bacterium H6797]